MELKPITPDAPIPALEVLLGAASGMYAAELSALSSFRRDALSAIAKIAVARLGDRVSEPGTPPPRIMQSLLAVGSYVNDQLSAAYWGGVIASARTIPGNDDRGVRWLKLLERLSRYQIRTHYLYYATLRALCLARRDQRGDTFDFDNKRYRLAVYVPTGGFVRGMGLADAEIPGLGHIAVDVLNALGHENLVDGSNTGSEKYLKSFFKSDAVAGEGMVFAPSVLGIRLFLWAFGYGDRPLDMMLDTVLPCAVGGYPTLVDGAALVYDD